MSPQQVNHYGALEALVVAAAAAARSARQPHATPGQRLALLDAICRWVLLAEACHYRLPVTYAQVRQQVLMADLEAGRAGGLAPLPHENRLLRVLFP